MADRTARGRLVRGILAGACLLAGAAFLYRRAHPVITAPPVVAAVVPSASETPADWCAPGFESLRGGGCFAAAKAPSAPLIVYLHGRYARDASSEEMDRQRRLGVRATGRGFAVLALRGRLGACTAPELASWYCWPSNATNADAGPAVVDTWSVALSAARERTGGRRFLLGFSNGGYFAGLVASRGLLEMDALVVAHGGPVEPVHAVRGPVPLLLLSADDDVAQDDMIRFDEELTRDHWAHDSYARAGGHGLTGQDIDAALTFFTRAGESLPLVPPLPLHRAVRHVRDAGADVEAEAGAAPDEEPESPEASTPSPPAAEDDDSP